LFANLVECRADGCNRLLLSLGAVHVAVILAVTASEISDGEIISLVWDTTRKTLL
jgi:hypothetical protein